MGSVDDEEEEVDFGSFGAGSHMKCFLTARVRDSCAVVRAACAALR